MKKRIISLVVAVTAAFALCSTASAQTEYKDIWDMIRGKVPGVQVGQSSAGQMPQIVIRGIGTNSEHTQPLFLVDGIQSDNISYLEPKDVYSIDIIKDGTAAIYGMQGANGVIMITTKAAVAAAEQQAAEKKAAKAAKKAAKKKK